MHSSDLRDSYERFISNTHQDEATDEYTLRFTLLKFANFVVDWIIA